MYLRHGRVEGELGWVELGCWHAPLAFSLSPARPCPRPGLGGMSSSAFAFSPLELEKGNGDGNRSQTRHFAQFSPNPHLLCWGPMVLQHGFAFPGLRLL